jgi:hypothetical protein
MSDILTALEPAIRLNRDMMKALRGGTPLGENEVRLLVDLYYQLQKFRIGTNNRVKGVERDAKEAQAVAEPHEALAWFLRQFELLETQVPRVMEIYVSTHPMSWFFEQTLGVGNILAAGLLAHIDIVQAPTVGHIWRFAGLDPTMQWNKGEIRPWNAQLKTLCWKISDSFVKLSGRDDAFYGKLYRTRKALEVERNDKGLFGDQAAAKLLKFKIGKDTDAYAAYSTGKLPPAHLDARARRYAVKMFLSHLHECWRRETTGTEPVKPYVIGIKGHVDYIPPPQRKP